MAQKDIFSRRVLPKLWRAKAKNAWQNKVLRRFDFNTIVPLFCCIRCQTVSERRGSNFGSIHSPGVDQIGKPVFACIAVRKSSILKINLKLGG